ncbi:DUF6541 family protein [Mycobacterium talmoniae]|uniref:Transmembrane protein alanine and leucine rich n=1 Tax=Mycobacterium talmoniae TaxID=1858794 RepID=A0A1S1MYI9_9MYCO|nr:DUF6541 family protein [Mycobacterium talmoniae]OHU92446.1 hypothetical protein BKN37_24855 [Mycobacterium talmoniae]
MGLGFGVVIALLLQIVPGTIVARISRLTWPVAIAVGPALTYGVVAVTIVPLGAIGIPWNAWTALAALVVIAALAAGLRVLLARYRDTQAEVLAPGRGPAAVVAAGVLLGAVLIGYAALRGMPHWQTIPSTWDAVWHANTVQFILDTGQASPTHMGELRNVETHALLYYPSTFHALTAVFCQLTGAASTTGYTLNSLAAATWLFPVSAAVLTWRLLRGRATSPAATWRVAGAAATAAVLAASFTAVPYVEFGTAAMPNLVAYGLAVPAFALITSTPGHRDRIPVAVLALVGVFSVHISGGVIVVLFTLAWWLLDALWRPVRGRLVDLVTLASVAVVTGLVLLPQFLCVKQQEDIIAGHSFLTYLSKKRGLFDAVFQHSRHLNDFPVQYALIGLAAVGGLVLLVKRIWWPLALWASLIVVNVDAGTPLGGPVGAAAGSVGELFYNDPRRIAAVTTLLLAPMAGIGLCTLVGLAVMAARRLADRWTTSPAPAWSAATAVLLVVVTAGLAWYYLPRHRFLLGDKYDSVMIDQKDLDAFACLATLPGAHDTLIGNANTDGTAWMYAVADLHPLWTHYDYPMQQGPGYYRFIFWVHADDADTDPQVAEAVRALNIRYVLVSSPVVRGFALPDGLVSLDASKSWAKIYDNGGARIYEWHGHDTAANCADKR